MLFFSFYTNYYRATQRPLREVQNVYMLTSPVSFHPVFQPRATLFFYYLRNKLTRFGFSNK